MIADTYKVVFGAIEDANNMRLFKKYVPIARVEQFKPLCQKIDALLKDNYVGCVKFDVECDNKPSLKISLTCEEPEFSNSDQHVFYDIVQDANKLIMKSNETLDYVVLDLYVDL